MKNLLIIIILILTTINLYAKGDDMELLRLFPRIAMIGDSLSSGEIVHDDDRALGVLYGAPHPDRGIVNEGPACVDCIESSWCSHICRRIGAKATHWTKGGISAEGWLNIYNYFLALDKNKYPCVFIALGANDFWGYDLGKETDDLNSKTFSGYYNEIIKSVRHFHPECVIFCLSMYYDNSFTDKNQFGQTRADYSQGIKKISEQYKKCYYLDFANESENAFGKTKYERRGHYNSPGYLAVSYDIEKLANKALLENIHDLDDITLYF